MRISKYIDALLTIVLAGLLAGGCLSDEGAADKPTGCKIKKSIVDWTHTYGECKDGYAHGPGKAISHDGRRYEGGFKEGRFYGQGTLIHIEGDKYVGEFAYGRAHGKGVLTLPNGDRFEGTFSRGKRQTGKGILTVENKGKYVGEFMGDF